MGTFPIQSFFPSTFDTIEENIFPMYLMAHKAHSQTIINTLTTRPDLNYQHPVYGLTYLAVAVITRNHEVMDFLLKHPHVSLYTYDAAKLTPFHYATFLGDQKATFKLQGVAKIRHGHFFSFPPLQLQKFYYPTFPPQTSELARYNHNGRDLPLTPLTFKNLLGASFCSSVFYKEEDFLNAIAMTLHSSTLLNKKINEHLVCKISELDTNNLFPTLYLGSDGESLSVFSKNSIPAGTLCGVYGGKYNFHTDKETECVWNIHTGEYKNLLSSMKLGFPNVICYPVMLLAEGITLPVVITLNAIPSDYPLYRSESKPTPQSLHRQTPNFSQMYAFFEMHRLKFFIENENTFTHAELSHLEEYDHLEKLEYLFNRPNALVQLFLHKIVTYQELETLLSSQFFRAKVINKMNEEAIQHCMEVFKLFFSKDINQENFRAFWNPIFRKIDFFTFYAATTVLKDLPIFSDSIQRQIILSIDYIVSRFIINPGLITSHFLLECHSLLKEIPVEYVQKIYQVLLPKIDPNLNANLKEVFQTLI